MPLPPPVFPLMFINFGNFCLFFRKKDIDAVFWGLSERCSRQLFGKANRMFVSCLLRSPIPMKERQNMLMPFCALRG